MSEPAATFLTRFGARCAERRARISRGFPFEPEALARRRAVAALRDEVHGVTGEAALLGLEALAGAARALEGHLAHLGDPDGGAWRQTVAWARRLTVAGERAGAGKRSAAEAAALEADIRLAGAAPGAPEASEAVPRRRILVFDDDRLIRDILVDALGELGHTVAAAGDLLAFEAALAEFRPELILADMEMPDITGDDVCRTLKTRFDTEGIPIVIMSGAEDDALAERARAAGADGWVSKGRGPAAVTARLETLLGEIVF